MGAVRLHHMLIAMWIFMLMNSPALLAQTTSQGTICGVGTVTFVGLEGGFYGITAEDGKRYDPIVLDHRFHVAGLRIRFEARVREDVMSTHMWGTLVDILKIEILSE
jgi:hypothetical protein